MTEPWDPGALWMKARLFINRAIEPADLVSFDERALWASLALELLAKAALAKINPMLIADNTQPKSLMIAAGISADVTTFKSVPAKTLFERCQQAFKPFNRVQAENISHARNEYVHSAVFPFSDKMQDAWWGAYWSQAVILIQAQDRDLVDFVGDDFTARAEQYLQNQERAVEERVESLIARAQQFYEMRKADRLTSEVLRGRRFVEYLHDHHTRHACPACEGEGVLGGDYVVGGETLYADGLPVAVDKVIRTESFTCEHCGLVLERPDFMRVARLPEVFHVEEDYDVELDYAEYGND